MLLIIVITLGYISNKKIVCRHELSRYVYRLGKSRAAITVAKCVPKGLNDEVIGMAVSTEKERDLTQAYDKSPCTNRKCRKCKKADKLQYKNATKTSITH